MPRRMVTIVNDDTGQTTQVSAEAAGYFAGWRLAEESESAPPAPVGPLLPAPSGSTPKPFMRRDAAKTDKE